MPRVAQYSVKVALEKHREKSVAARVAYASWQKEGLRQKRSAQFQHEDLSYLKETDFVSMHGDASVTRSFLHRVSASAEVRCGAYSLPVPGCKSRDASGLVCAPLRP